MLTRPDERSEQVTTAHQAKLAYVYVRQSSAGEVPPAPGEHGTAVSTGRPGQQFVLAARTDHGDRR